MVSPASPPDRNSFARGVAELEHLQYRVRLASPEMRPDGYFAGPLAKRAAELQAALLDDQNQAIIAPRGGYGTGPVLDRSEVCTPSPPEIGDWLQRSHHAASVFVAALALGNAVRTDGDCRFR